MNTSVPDILPPENYLQIIEETAIMISDPVKKLQFLNHVINNYHKIPSLYKYYRPMKDAIFRKIILYEAEHINPEISNNARELLRQRFTSDSHHALWKMYKRRHIIISIITAFLLFCIAMSMSSLIEIINAASIKNIKSLDKNTVTLPLNQSIPQNKHSADSLPKTTLRYGEYISRQFPNYLNKQIWLVEKTSDREIYSNRLQIITSYTVENIPRRYYRFSKNTSQLPAKDQITNKVTGILFHSSESDISPFKPEMNKSIKEKSMLLIRYIMRTKSYHYFIDRFGRVYRLVKDDHAAFHAGNSVWADDESFYLNLNSAFIGICFEGKDFEKVGKTVYDTNSHLKTANISVKSTLSINEVQLTAGKELTDWLRVKFKIPQCNCVPHGLASVNPYNMLIGYHLDLTYGFPFNRFELNDKYQNSLPSITEFGFSYDNYFVRIFKGRLWPGIHYSEEQLRQKAKNLNMSLHCYRKHLQRRFTNFFKWQKKQEHLLNS